MEKQRLDKIIASTGKFSRREVKSLVRQGLVRWTDDWPPRLRKRWTRSRRN